MKFSGPKLLRVCQHPESSGRPECARSDDEPRRAPPLAAGGASSPGSFPRPSLRSAFRLRTNRIIFGGFAALVATWAISDLTYWAHALPVPIVYPVNSIVGLTVCIFALRFAFGVWLLPEEADRAVDELADFFDAVSSHLGRRQENAPPRVRPPSRPSAGSRGVCPVTPSVHWFYTYSGGGAPPPPRHRYSRLLTPFAASPIDRLFDLDSPDLTESELRRRVHAALRYLAGGEP